MKNYKLISAVTITVASVMIGCAPSQPAPTPPPTPEITEAPVPVEPPPVVKPETAKAEPAPVPKAELKPEVKAETKPAAAPTPAPVAAAAPKTVGKTAAKPVVKVAAKSAPAPVASVSGTKASPGDWAEWGGGKHRNMYSPAKGLASSFDPGKFKKGTEEIDMATTKNVKFVLKLGSQTYGNPTIAAGRIYAGTNNEAPRDPRFKGDKSILMCYDEKTGAFLWQLVVPKLKSGKVNDWENLGILSSAVVENDRVYLVTSRCEVICLDAKGQSNGNQGMQDEGKYMSADTGKPPAEVTSKDADILWVYDMMGELGVFPHNAANSSPVIIGDLVYVCTSNGQDWTHVNVPSPQSPSFIAVDKNTGKLKGEDDAGIGEKIFHGQWSSPSGAEVANKWQVFFGGGNGLLYGFGATPVFDSSEDIHFLKKLWWVDTNPPERFKHKYPDPEGPNEINSTPVYYKGKVYAAHGQDPEHGEGVGMLVCVDPTKKGDITKTGVVWKYSKINRSISTVSIDPETGLLFAGDFSGFVYCLDADTGKENWVYDMKAHMWGSTMVADGKVYVGDEDGDFVILPAKKDFKPKEDKPIFQTNMFSPIYSTPVVANGVIYVGTQTHLYAIKE